MIDLNLIIEEQKRRESQRDERPFLEIQVDDRPPRPTPVVDFEVRYEL